MSEPLPDDVLVLLQEIAGEHDVAWHEKQAIAWANSGDLNEAWIANIGLEAAQLLAKYASPEPS